MAKSKELKNKFEFLKSVRFWKLVIIGILQALVGYGVIDAIIADSLSTILGLDVVINTVDRFSSKE